MSCELCDLVAGDIKTQFYYRNSNLVIVNCLTCNVPMLVFYHHGEATEAERRLAREVIKQIFGYRDIRTESHKIKGHEHWHLL